jgi:hypothetical protein
VKPNLDGREYRRSGRRAEGIGRSGSARRRAVPELYANGGPARRRRAKRGGATVRADENSEAGTRLRYRKRRWNCLMMPLLSVSAITSMW